MYDEDFTLNPEEEKWFNLIGMALIGAVVAGAVTVGAGLGIGVRALTRRH